MASFVQSIARVRSDDVIYIYLPLYHSAGFLMGLCGAIEKGDSWYETAVKHDFQTASSPKFKRVYDITGSFVKRPKGFMFTTLAVLSVWDSIVSICVSLFLGTTIFLRGKFSASQFWNDCRKYNVTVIQYIGEIMRYLCNTPKVILTLFACIVLKWSGTTMTNLKRALRHSACIRKRRLI